MATATIADDVHHYVLVELLTVVEGNLSNPDNSFWIISVDMENRSLNALGEVSGVGGGPGIFWQGCEANLVIHDHVNGSTNFVTFQLAELHGLRDNTLTRKCSITVNENRQHWIVFWVAKSILLSSHDSLENRVNRFKV